MSDSVYEALQLCKTKGVQDIVILLISRKVDLSQNKLDIAKQKTFVINELEYCFDWDVNYILKDEHYFLGNYLILKWIRKNIYLQNFGFVD